MPAERMEEMNKEVDALYRIAEFERKTPKEKWELGWDWQQPGVLPGVLNKLVAKQLIAVTYKSVRYTNYKMTELGWNTFREIETGKFEEQQADEVLSRVEPHKITLPDNLFEDIVGYQDVKELLREVLQLDDQFHVLLVGPPALAKTMFLCDIELAVGTSAMWVVGSAASKAGVWDQVAERKPRILLITELEKMNPVDTAGLLSLMEGGRLARAKVHRAMDVIVKAKVVADANRVGKLPDELLSRFARKYLAPYDAKDFLKVVEHVLARREGLSDDDASKVALKLLGKTQDVRDAIRVGRLAKRVGVDRAVELLGM